MGALTEAGVSAAPKPSLAKTRDSGALREIAMVSVI